MRTTAEAAVELLLAAVPAEEESLVGTVLVVVDSGLDEPEVVDGTVVVIKPV